MFFDFKGTSFFRFIRAKKIGSSVFLISIFWIFFLNSCIQTSLHLNGGKVLSPGLTKTTVGLGISLFQEIKCPENEYSFTVDNYLYIDYNLLPLVSNKYLCSKISTFQSFDSIKKEPLSTMDTQYVSAKTKKSFIPKLLLERRYGLNLNYLIFRGLELGLILEGPFTPSLETQLRLGLKGLPIPWAHSLGFGLLTGSWGNPGMYIEYGIDREIIPTKLDVFSNFRFSLLPSPLGDRLASLENKTPFSSNQNSLIQNSWGIHYFPSKKLRLASVLTFHYGGYPIMKLEGQQMASPELGLWIDGGFAVSW